MFSIKPEAVIRLALCDQFVLTMRRDYNRALYDLRNSKIESIEETEVSGFVKQNTGLDIPSFVLKNILDLYPEVRIRISQNHGVIDTDVGDILLDCISHFFLGCTWPRGDDDVDINKFTEILQSQARTFNLF